MTHGSPKRTVLTVQISSLNIGQELRLNKKRNLCLNAKLRSVLGKLPTALFQGVPYVRRQERGVVNGYYAKLTYLYPSPERTLAVG
jgi:hypothetical protein